MRRILSDPIETAAVGGLFYSRVGKSSEGVESSSSSL
jgi:hypothetical protein